MISSYLMNFLVCFLLLSPNLINLNSLWINLIPDLDWEKMLQTFLEINSAIFTSSTIFILTILSTLLWFCFFSIQVMSIFSNVYFVYGIIALGMMAKRLSTWHSHKTIYQTLLYCILYVRKCLLIPKAVSQTFKQYLYSMSTILKIQTFLI